MIHNLLSRISVILLLHMVILCWNENPVTVSDGFMCSSLPVSVQDEEWETTETQRDLTI